MLWEQALLRILHAQYCETRELMSVIQVTDACDVGLTASADDNLPVRRTPSIRH